MDDTEWLAERFAEHRTRLRALGCRMLGSYSEAEDAFQETWLRLSRSDISKVDLLADPGRLAELDLVFVGRGT